MKRFSDVSAVILAGGLARRFGGKDKGWLNLNGKPLIKHVLDRIEPQVGCCMINANRNFDHYHTLAVPVISDIEGDYQGPLMGMATALHHAQSDWVLCIPCDTPDLPADLVERLYQQVLSEGSKLAVAHDGNRRQSVVILLHRSLQGSLLDFLSQGERKVGQWIDQQHSTTVYFENSDAFININQRDDLQLLERLPPILGFVGWSGAGKTTLLEKLVAGLSNQGLKLGLIKHSHHLPEIDKPGKDSYRLKQAGAEQLVLCSDSQRVAIHTTQQKEISSLSSAISALDCSALDLILVEGYKTEVMPKIEVYRESVDGKLLYKEDDQVIALVSERNMGSELPEYNFDQHEQLLSFICQYFSFDQKV